MATLPNSPFFSAIMSHAPESTAIVHSLSGRTFTYGSLVRDVAEAKKQLVRDAGKEESGSLEGERVAFILENGYDYVVTLLSILAASGIAVPLAPGFPAGELRYILDHSQARLLLSSQKFSAKAEEVLKEGLENTPKSLRVRKILEGKSGGDVKLEEVKAEDEKGGMMLYTSGTTNRPSPAPLHMFEVPSLTATLLPLAQARSLHEAWTYSPSDYLLHVLPLHHIHGTVNAILTPLLAGSAIEFMFPFNVDAVWKRFAAPFLDSSDTRPKPITFFTVVPTIYTRLLAAHGSLPTELQEAARQALLPPSKGGPMRLNISGSAALPSPVRKSWEELSGGNVLLERYGMTEVGMALSCGLEFSDRVDGSVGWPLPSVQARLVETTEDEEGKTTDSKVIEIGEEIDANGKERQGEIQLRGPTIFREYWRNPDATAKEHTSDGWFKTGDVAIRRRVDGAGAGKSGDWAKGPIYFIQGRSSADIIKTGGEKVSALEIEREMLALPEISECAVVGLPSEAWGQKVAAVVVLSEKGRSSGKGGKPYSALDLRRALKDKIVAYKMPQEMKAVETIPRNAMGKINKKTLVKEVFGDLEAIRRRSVEFKKEKAAQKAAS
ncbi:hypothetical protein LTR66_005937 [Elasticomyces elasticus]|nr:hypothetical protein LTR66_005937 [Elasticomyces elasticus]